MQSSIHDCTSRKTAHINTQSLPPNTHHSAHSALISPQTCKLPFNSPQNLHNNTPSHLIPRNRCKQAPSRPEKTISSIVIGQILIRQWLMLTLLSLRPPLTLGRCFSSLWGSVHQLLHEGSSQNVTLRHHSGEIRYCRRTDDRQNI
jgi:hypothetical protein